MTPPGKKSPFHFTDLSKGLICISGTWIFALFIQRGSFLQYFAYAGLLLSALAIAGSARDIKALLGVLALRSFHTKVIYYGFGGLILGSALAMLNNFLNTGRILPLTLTGFALVASLIGITEELIFRGFVQTKIYPTGRFPAIVVASIGHTFYKYLVISTLPDDLQVNYPGLILLTFIVGMVFGFLRDRSGSILPPAFAHAAFDILVYGAVASAPVWVWGVRP